MGRRDQQADHRPDRLHEDVLRQAHAAQHPDEVLRLRRRPQAAGDAARTRSSAAERILQRIEISTNYKQLGTLEAGGYVWHTTGSGKTLTSFKAAQLASKLPYVDKVLFVVDRKDLDYQTMREYDRFEKGAATRTSRRAC